MAKNPIGIVDNYETYILAKNVNNFYTFIDAKKIEDVPLRGISVLPTHKFRIQNYNEILKKKKHKNISIQIFDRNSNKMRYYNVIGVGNGFFNLTRQLDYGCIIL